MSVAATNEIAIIGTGFSGLGMAIALKRSGVDDFVVLEKGDDVGGTWRDNDYPGCACDVPSHLYSFSFAPNPGWSRQYAPQVEILDYLRRCAHRFGVMPHVRFAEHVVSASFDEAERAWIIRSADAREMSRYLQGRGEKHGTPIDMGDPDLPPIRVRTARFLVSAMGGLSTPAIPRIEGLETFAGRCFHSQAWDHVYDLTGKRVAVVGTGASAIQFVPQIAPQVARLDVYQRTPPWILPRPDRAITDLERTMFRRLPAIQQLYRAAIYLRMEGRVLGFGADARLMKLAERWARAHLRKQVTDASLRRKLQPAYALGCKRILLSNDYYPALTRPNVNLITDGIRAVRGGRVVSETGVEREVDAIILGTGFRATSPIARGTLHGLGGVDLADSWADGPEAYKGTTVAGFPNLFLIVGPNCGLAHSSMVLMIESQIAYVMDALHVMRARRLRVASMRADVQAEYNRTLQRRLGDKVWSAGGCRSWYLHESGKNVALWPGFTRQFRRITRRFDVDNYEVAR